MDMNSIDRRESTRARIGRALAALMIAIVCCMMLIPATSLAKPSDEKQAEADAARARLNEMAVQLEQASDQYYTALAEHDVAIEKMNAAQARIEELKGEIKSSQDMLRKRAVSMYRNDQASMFDVLLGSASFKDFATTWNFLVSLNEETADIIEHNRALKTENEEMLAQYTEQEQIAADKLS